MKSLPRLGGRLLHLRREKSSLSFYSVAATRISPTSTTYRRLRVLPPALHIATLQRGSASTKTLLTCSGPSALLSGTTRSCTKVTLTKSTNLFLFLAVPSQRARAAGYRAIAVKYDRTAICRSKWLLQFMISDKNFDQHS